MFTQTSKVFLPVAGGALLIGAIYKILTADLLGGVLYLMVGTVAFLLGIVLSSIRENEYAPVVPADAPPPVVRRVVSAPLPGGGGWTVLGAVAIGLVLFGLVENALITWAGLLAGLAALAGWMARASSESSGRAISPAPIGIPMVGLFVIASVMFFLSRILLAVTETTSWVLALAVALVLMFVASIAALRPTISGRTLTVALVLGSLVMIGGGVVAAAVGEREIEHHVEAHGGEAALVQLGAQNITFSRDTINLAANADVEIRLDNNDRDVQHNITILGQDASRPVFRGELVTGVATVTYRFHSPGPGEYRFQCDVHPAQMKGTVKVA